MRSSEEMAVHYYDMKLVQIKYSEHTSAGSGLLLQWIFQRCNESAQVPLRRIAMEQTGTIRWVRTARVEGRELRKQRTCMGVKERPQQRRRVHLPRDRPPRNPPPATPTPRPRRSMAQLLGTPNHPKILHPVPMDLVHTVSTKTASTTQPSPPSALTLYLVHLAFLLVCFFYSPNFPPYMPFLRHLCELCLQVYVMKFWGTASSLLCYC
jgi:hypothetical protein